MNRENTCEFSIALDAIQHGNDDATDTYLIAHDGGIERCLNAAIASSRRHVVSYQTSARFDVANDDGD
jgi:hypothetical protein